MGMTKADMHKDMYNRWRQQGLSHKKCMKRVPRKKRAAFEADINKTWFERHYGMRFKTFFTLTSVFGIVSSMLLGYFLFNNKP
jgi:hypothetical protein